MASAVSPVRICSTCCKWFFMKQIIRLLILLALVDAAGAAPAIVKPVKSNQPFVELDPSRIVELAVMLPEKARGFGAPCSDRSVWSALATNASFKKAVVTATRQLGNELPPWSDDLYLDYSRTGKRPAGEKMMGNRHGLIRQLVWAECIENQGRFMPDIEKMLLEYAQEPTWTLPAHDRNLSCFKGTAYSVDLASSAFGHELAQVLWLLGDKISAGTCAKVMGALEQRIFAPLRESFRTGKGNGWLHAEMNWNPVCLSGGVGAALAVLPDRRDRALFAAAGEHYSRYYLAGFSPDGYLGEGMGYWNYGMSHFLLLREQLWQTTRGKVDLFADAKVRNAALYGINAEMVSGFYPAIADCRWGTKPSEEVLWYLSRALGLGLRRYENTYNPMNPSDLVFAPMRIFPNSLSAVKSAGIAREGLGLRYFFEQAGVLVCRTAPDAGPPMGAALKGGHNDEPHNHNDVGSFTFVVGKEAFVADPGGPFVYSSKTFGKERYTAFKLFSSLGHDVPVVAGRAQIPGKLARAKILATKFSGTSDEISMDIASAYDAPELKKLVRTFVFDRRSETLKVSDDFEFNRPAAFEVALTTRAEWQQVAPDKIELRAGGERVVAEIQAPGGVTITSETIAEDSPAFTRIGLKLKDPLASGKVVVLLSSVKTAK